MHVGHPLFVYVNRAAAWTLAQSTVLSEGYVITACHTTLQRGGGGGGEGGEKGRRRELGGTFSRLAIEFCRQ